MKACINKLGEQLLKDPTVASDLLMALTQSNAPASCIKQSWLNVHWHKPNMRIVLTAIRERWDLMPQPRIMFLRVCWQHNDSLWHHFVTPDLLDSSSKALEIFHRLHYEGPRPKVLRTLLFLNRDDLVPDMVPCMINEAALRGSFTEPLLQLWLRNNAAQGILDVAFTKLRHALESTQQNIAGLAMHLVNRLPLARVKLMLPPVAKLASRNDWFDYTVHSARQLITDWSYLPENYSVVARSVRAHPWQQYVENLNPNTLLLLVDYLQRHRAVDVLIGLMHHFTPRAVVNGVFTGLLSCVPTAQELQRLQGTADCALTENVHGAIYYMYTHKTVVANMFEPAMRLHSHAMQALAKHVKAVERELKWHKRKLVMCCLALSAHNHTCASKNVLQHLKQHSQAWPVVLQYL